jgi:putative SOS response-associated peptidase YedK
MPADQVASREKEESRSNQGQGAVNDEGPGQAQHRQASRGQRAERRAALAAQRDPSEGGAAALARYEVTVQRVGQRERPAQPAIEMDEPIDATEPLGENSDGAPTLMTSLTRTWSASRYTPPMCGRFTQTAAFDVLALRFGITVEDTGLEDVTARYNVSPSRNVPVIVASNGHRKLVMARWGFHPSWMKDTKLAPINARAETVATSRMFQAAVRDARCLVPATGFYEWKAIPGQKRKQPYYIRLKEGAPFAFAGLWTPPHLAPPTCTIITTTPNEVCAPIHNRMPVILDPNDEALWLDASVIAPVKVLRCLRALPADRMEAYPVSTLVSSPRNEGAQLVEPVPA